MNGFIYILQENVSYRLENGGSNHLSNVIR